MKAWRRQLDKKERERSYFVCVRRPVPAGVVTHQTHQGGEAVRPVHRPATETYHSDQETLGLPYFSLRP